MQGYGSVEITRRFVLHECDYLVDDYFYYGKTLIYTEHFNLVLNVVGQRDIYIITEEAHDYNTTEHTANYACNYS